MVRKNWLHLLMFTVLLSLCVLIALAGCSSAAPATPTATTTAPATKAGISFSKDIQPIFAANCLICHQGAAGIGGLSLDPAAAYNNLVNKPSTESSLMRVVPGAPEKSYLLNKVLGTQTQAGGIGAQMPFNAPPLSQDMVNKIQQWISQGALNN
jgi:hypothetical protein